MSSDELTPQDKRAIETAKELVQIAASHLPGDPNAVEKCEELYTEAALEEIEPNVAAMLNLIAGRAVAELVVHTRQSPGRIIARLLGT